MEQILHMFHLQRDAGERSVDTVLFFDTLFQLHDRLMDPDVEHASVGRDDQLA